MFVKPIGLQEKRGTISFREWARLPPIGVESETVLGGLLAEHPGGVGTEELASHLAQRLAYSVVRARLDLSRDWEK